MLPHPVAVAPDVDDVAMVQEPVDERRRHDLVAEHVSPFLEALVRGQHRRRPLVPGVDQLEEEHGAVLADRQVADLVDHEQRGMRQHAQPPGQRSRGPGVGERVDQACQRPVVDASAGLGGRLDQADTGITDDELDKRWRGVDKTGMLSGIVAVVHRQPIPRRQ